jgi:hypothetical protein
MLSGSKMLADVDSLRVFITQQVANHDTEKYLNAFSSH